MKGAIPTETIVLFIGSLLAVLVVASLTVSILGSYADRASTLSADVRTRSTTAAEMVSAFYFGRYTYVLVEGIAGEIPLDKVTLLVDGIPQDFSFRVYRGDGDDVLEKGELFYLILPYRLEDGSSLVLRSTQVSAHIGVASGLGEFYFPYRVRVKVTNTSNSTPTDYPVRVELNADNFQLDHLVASDCTDIRPVDENMKPLDYYIEECGQRVILWVKLPRLDPEVNFYLLYGRSGLPNDSNGQRVFTFFEDFDSLAGWSCTRVCDYVRTDVVDGRTVLVLTAPAGDYGIVYSKNTFNDLNNVALEIYTRLQGTAGDLDFFWGIDDYPSGGPDWGSTPGDNALDQYHRCFVDERDANMGYTYMQNVWLVDQVKRFGDTVICTYNGESLTATGTPIDSGLIIFHYDPDTLTREIYVDWVRIRKVVDPEPTVVVGPEESGKFVVQ